MSAKQINTIQFITVREVLNPDFIRTIRNLGNFVFRLAKVKPSQAPSWLLDEYSKSRIRITDKNGQEFDWPDHLFVPHWSLFDKGSENYDEKCRKWVSNTFYKIVPDDVMPRVSSKYCCLFRCFSTLILVARPDLANLLPRQQQIMSLNRKNMTLENNLGNQQSSELPFT